MFFVSKDILDTETAKNVFKKEAMDRSIVKDRKQQFIESHKAEQRTLFDKRKLERFALAQESQQSYIEKYNNTQSDVLSRLAKMPPEKRRNLAVSKSSILNSVCNTQDNLWNYYTKLAPKQINKNFTPLAVKLEEECVIRIRDKIVAGNKV
jgi:dGTP triphosphohydrolase